MFGMALSKDWCGKFTYRHIRWAKVLEAETTHYLVAKTSLGRIDSRKDEGIPGNIRTNARRLGWAPVVLILYKIGLGARKCDRDMAAFFTPRRIENISRLFVIICCVIVCCVLLLVCVLNPSPFVLFPAVTYYGVAWIVPAIMYRQGVINRKKKRLLLWCLTIFVQTLCMVITCIMILYNHSTSRYLAFDATCVVAVILLVMTPIFLA